MIKELVLLSLECGGLLCLLLGIFIELTMYINSEMWLKDYPLDIRKKFGIMSRRAVLYRKFAGLIFLIIITGVLVFTISRLNAHAFINNRRLIYFIVVFCVLQLFNIFDLLILDFLIFIKIKPNYIVLKGTEGQSGYSNYRFHFNGFINGTCLWLFLSVLLAFMTNIF